MNTEGPLALLWMGIGLGCFYVALIWVNTLLPMFLTPLFIIPLTWVLERFGIGVAASAKEEKGRTNR